MQRKHNKDIVPTAKMLRKMFTYALSIFLTSTAFVSTNAKYGIPLSRYAVFLYNENHAIVAWFKRG